MTSPSRIIELRVLDWIEYEVLLTKEPGRPPRFAGLRAWPAPAFLAFRSALLYSIHKYAGLLDWAVLDAITIDDEETD